MGNYNKNRNRQHVQNTADKVPTNDATGQEVFKGKQTPAVIENWKRTHGNVYQIKTEKGEYFYVRSPKIQEIEAYQPLLQQSKFITYNIGLFKTCYLGGASIPSDEATLSSIAGQMMKTVETVASEVEKL